MRNAVTAIDTNTDKPSSEEDASRLAADIESLGNRLQEVRGAIGQVIFGQNEVIDEALITILAGGHALLIGVPGLAKTRLVQTLGTVLGLEDKRIQFTPDLMPADILGSEVLEESDSGTRSFRFIQGPVFCQLLMADDAYIGYAPSRVFGTPTTMIWVYRLGLEHAKQFLLTGEAIDAETQTADTCEHWLDEVDDSVARLALSRLEEASRYQRLPLLRLALERQKK